MKTPLSVAALNEAKDQLTPVARALLQDANQDDQVTVYLRGGHVITGYVGDTDTPAVLVLLDADLASRGELSTEEQEEYRKKPSTRFHIHKGWFNVAMDDVVGYRIPKDQGENALRIAAGAQHA